MKITYDRPQAEDAVYNVRDMGNVIIYQDADGDLYVAHVYTEQVMKFVIGVGTNILLNDDLDEAAKDITFPLIPYKGKIVLSN